MSRKLKILTLLISNFCLAFQLGASEFLWDFQDSDPGSAPEGTGVSVFGVSEGTTQVVVTGGELELHDPFGEPGNRSVYLSREESAAKHPILQLQLSSPLRDGRLEFDLFLPGDMGTGLMEVDLGDFGGERDQARAKSLAAVQFTTRASGASQGKVSCFSGSSKGSDIVSTRGESRLDKNKVIISWSGIDGTYRIILNGETVTSEKHPDGVFPATNPELAEVSTIRFTTAASAASPSYYIDNVRVNGESAQ
ncbi:hypothetical protein [Puniceicoccus vermicola]|uniref:LamG domain-containing protein n=1 Tax=Puniceicoccus vermicola TaxID=388746 RepID=A0A7X1AY67_9BACT|nr:hypothetical protein [Puniceicoccus vermicola]MBC2602146.1 hypothetical protein [Puniceicoccus vermicola]